MITITKVGSLVKIEHEGGETFVSQNDRPYFRHTTSTDHLTFRVGEVRIDEYPLSSFSIGGVTPTNISELTTQLQAVFPSTNSGSGGSGGAPVLQSPDTTLWLIGVNDSGALQTTVTDSGTPTQLFRWSPDGTKWEITVNNSGALTTTAV